MEELVMVVILSPSTSLRVNSAKNLIISNESTVEILRPMPQNDIASLPLDGGGPSQGRRPRRPGMAGVTPALTLLQDIPAQILILHKVLQFLSDIFGINDRDLAGHLRRIKRNFIE